jgi:hypothetical protein
MRISLLDGLNIQDVASLMARLKPEFWDLEGALA